MDIKEGQEFYVVSANWIKNWKTYIGFDGMEGGDFPGPITNDDIIEEEK